MIHSKSRKYLIYKYISDGDRKNAGRDQILEVKSRSYLTILGQLIGVCYIYVYIYIYIYHIYIYTHTAHKCQYV